MMYRKKPVVIEAVTWYGKYTDGTEWPGWFREAVDAGVLFRSVGLGDSPEFSALQVKTLEGVMTANVGDKIIRGVKGEIYPCKPDIFEATYEAVA
jgi:hypothetical protein